MIVLSEKFFYVFFKMSYVSLYDDYDNDFDFNRCFLIKVTLKLLSECVTFVQYRS